MKTIRISLVRPVEHDLILPAYFTRTNPQGSVSFTRIYQDGPEVKEETITGKSYEVSDVDTDYPLNILPGSKPITARYYAQQLSRLADSLINQMQSVHDHCLMVEGN